MALKDNLISVWELSEASGNAIDAHSTNDLTETGGTIASAAGPSALDGSRDFEAGDTEHFELADNADLSVGDIDFTVAAWVNSESLYDSNRNIIAKWNFTSNNREYILAYTNSSGRFTFRVSSNGTSGGASTATANNLGAPSASTWYHIVAWHDATNNQIGIAVNAGTADTTAHATGVFNGTSPFQIGVDEASDYWDGLIAQAALWKRVISSAERTELYAAGAGLPYADWDAAAGATTGHHLLLLGVG